MICGQNLNMDAIIDQVTKMKSDLLGGMDLDASALKSQLASGIDSLVSDIRNLVPEMPSIPSINLQTEFSNLLTMDVSSPAYLSKLTELKGQFGDALTAAGKDFDTMLGGLSTGSFDVCKDIPNFELPDGTTEVVEKAAGVLKAQTESLTEQASTMTTNEGLVKLKKEMESASANWTSAPTMGSTVFTVSEKTSTLLSEASTEIKIATSSDSVTVLKTSTTAVTTVPAPKLPQGSIVAPTGIVERTRSNYNSNGFTSRPKSGKKVWRKDFDNMDLGFDPLTIRKVTVTWEDHHGNKHRFGRLKNEDYYEDDPHWDYDDNWGEGGKFKIKLFNISNPKTVWVFYKTPSNFDPRFKKHSESDTIAV